MHSLPSIGQVSPQFSLDDFRWQYRILLVFAPDPEDVDYVKVMDRVRQTKRDFDDRDMLMVEVVGVTVRVADSLDVSPPAAEQLRVGFSVSVDDFQVLLIGKDGGVKARSGSPHVLPEIYALIDTMPMRRLEMKRRE